MVAVLVIGVVSILIATSGGSGTAAGGDCDNREADGQGFSECMRTVAGAVVEKNDCEKGVKNPLGGEAIETPGATSATCTMEDDYTVTYMHFGSSDGTDGSEQSGADTAKQYLDTVKDQYESLGAGSNPEEGDWSGEGMSGSFYSIDLGLGNGVLIFQVNDSPVAGMVTHVDTSGSGGGGGPSIKDFFEQHVKPGSDGGA